MSRVRATRIRTVGPGSILWGRAISQYPPKSLLPAPSPRRPPVTLILIYNLRGR